METEGLSWEMSLVVAMVFMVVVGVLVWNFMFPGHHRTMSSTMRKELVPPRPPRPKREVKPAPAYHTRNNGWIRVISKALDPIDDEEETAFVEVGRSVPFIVQCWLTTATISDRAWWGKHWGVWCQNVSGAERDAYLDDAKRGITIGSALFGYAIPEHLFLLDRRTRQLSHVFLRGQAIRFTYDAWMAREEKLIADHMAMVTRVFELPNQINANDACDFYFEHEKKIEYMLLHTINETSVLPAYQGLVRNALFESGLLNNPIGEHYFFIAATIVARQAQLVLPLNWFMITPVSQEAYVLVQRHLASFSNLSPDTPKSHLTLAVDNTNQ